MATSSYPSGTGTTTGRLTHGQWFAGEIEHDHNGYGPDGSIWAPPTEEDIALANELDGCDPAPFMVASNVSNPADRRLICAAKTLLLAAAKALAEFRRAKALADRTLRGGNATVPFPIIGILAAAIAAAVGFVPADAPCTCGGQEQEVVP